MMLSLLLSLALASSGGITEPHTKVHFDARLEAAGVALALTGVDRRRALDRDAYAVAHYIATPDTGGLHERTAEDRLSAWIETPAHKLLIFEGVYKSVPAHGIRLSWKKHFKDLGLTPHAEFVAAFQEPFQRGDRLYFQADPEGRLEVRHDDRLLGAWTDPALVRALWAMCLGPTTEIVARENLAALTPEREAVAARSDSNANTKEAM